MRRFVQSAINIAMRIVSVVVIVIIIIVIDGDGINLTFIEIKFKIKIMYVLSSQQMLDSKQMIFQFKAPGCYTTKGKSRIDTAYKWQ